MLDNDYGIEKAYVGNIDEVFEGLFWPIQNEVLRNTNGKLVGTGGAIAIDPQVIFLLALDMSDRTGDGRNVELQLPTEPGLGLRRNNDNFAGSY